MAAGRNISPFSYLPKVEKAASTFPGCKNGESKLVTSTHSGNARLHCDCTSVLDILTGSEFNPR